jgi:hypothetical protein
VIVKRDRGVYMINLEREREREREIFKPVIKLRILRKWNPSQNLDSEKTCLVQISEDMTENLRRGWVKLFQVYCICIHFIYVQYIVNLSAVRCQLMHVCSFLKQLHYDWHI